jgi:phosphoribosylformylglycinamidine cyclo-ligase
VTTYKDAGVDIDAGNALVERIKPLAGKTFRIGQMGGLGGFGALFDPKGAGFTDPILVSTTDGVGTKLRIAQAMGIHNTIGIDLVAMCVNDIVVQGARPLFFLDYFATGKLDVETAVEVIGGIANACRETNTVLAGGETAEMPDMYGPGEYDLAGFCVGAAERDTFLDGFAVVEGDFVIGLASNGVHSNGFSLVRKIIRDAELTWKHRAPWLDDGTLLGEALLAPTKLYVTPCLAALATGGVHAMAHITGGGLIENIPRVIGDTTLGVELTNWPLPPVFGWLQRQGNIAPAEMHRTFNCGIGMVLICAERKVLPVMEVLAAAEAAPVIIGRVCKHPGERVSFRDDSAKR